MKKIKFRVWDTKNKEWVKEIPSLEYLLDNPNAEVSHHDIDDGSAFYFDPENVLGLTFNKRLIYQEYTGLKDKNGREIYEGDIVNFIIPGITHGPEEEICENHKVEWDEEFACWSFIFVVKGINRVSYSIGVDRIDTDSFEVVGNIFENPELLK